MRVYFLRHGIAEERAESDHARRLTAGGVTRMRTTARIMASLGMGIGAVYTSPRVRCQQTADIVASALGVPCITRDELNFGFDVDGLQAIRHDNAHGHPLLVGHEPTFSTVIGELTGADILMKKGGLARVDLTRDDPPMGVLVWLIAPKVFTALS